MPLQPPPRLPAAAASVLAAGLMLTAASCSHLTPLGPDPAATMPQPHHLRSPLVLQDMRVATVVLVVTAAAALVIISLIIAAHS